jgi:hypothetical protein
MERFCFTLKEKEEHMPIVFIFGLPIETEMSPVDYQMKLSVVEHRVKKEVSSIK